MARLGRQRRFRVAIRALRVVGAALFGYFYKRENPDMCGNFADFSGGFS